jgi:hypothetical protein
MLKVFRDNLKYLSWILWGVILVFVGFVFVDFGGAQLGQQGRPNDSAATVGGVGISYGELQRAYQQTESAYRDAYGGQFTPELARQLQLPLQVLESLVQQQILLAEADRMGLAVSDAELQKELLRQPVLLDEQGNFVGSERYRQTATPTSSGPIGNRQSGPKSVMPSCRSPTFATRLRSPPRRSRATSRSTSRSSACRSGAESTICWSTSTPSARVSP